MKNRLLKKCIAIISVIICICSCNNNTVELKNTNNNIVTKQDSFSQEVMDYKLKTTKNSLERKAILDLARKDIFDDLKQDVLFNVDHLKVSGNYAWFEGKAVRTDGKELEFPDETYDCCHVEGLFEKVQGKWKIVEFGSFSTDCWYCGIAYLYPKVPKGIFTEAPLSK